MKNAHGAPESRWPVIIACAILCAILIAAGKKWAHKDLEHEPMTNVQNTEVQPTPALEPMQSTVDQPQKPAGKKYVLGNTRATKQGITDAERASLPLDQFLLAEGLDVDRIQADPSAVERRLQIRADSLTEGQRLDLQERILSADAPMNEKQVAVHLLTLNVPASVPVLKSIAVAPVAVSKTAEGIPPELPLRLSALQGLEKASLRDPQYRKALLEVSEHSPNKTVREVAQLSAQQAAKGRSFFDDYTKVLAGEKHK